jgi:hypothetical protein
MSVDAGHQRRALLAVGIALLPALLFTLTCAHNRASASADAHWAWITARPGTPLQVEANRTDHGA